MLVFGSSIGAGNYVPEADRRIFAENDVASQAFNAKTGTSGFSDVAATTLYYESDSLACIGKGARALRVYISANDVGSAATDTYFQAGSVISTIGAEFICNTNGLANDQKAKIVGWIPCAAANAYQYQIEASAGSTFDINAYKYIGCEWR